MGLLKTIEIKLLETHFLSSFHWKKKRPCISAAQKKAILKVMYLSSILSHRARNYPSFNVDICINLHTSTYISFLSCNWLLFINWFICDGACARYLRRSWRIQYQASFNILFKSNTRVKLSSTKLCTK